MGDLESLLARDHAEIDRLIAILSNAEPASADWQTALDGARRSFVAHADAEEQALTSVISARDGGVSRLVAYILDAHRRQRELIDRLAEDRPVALRINDALELRASLISHDEQERLILLPSLRDALPLTHYEQLARFYSGRRVFTGTVLPAPRPFDWLSVR